MLSKLLSNHVFSRFEGEVGNEDGVAGRAQVVSKGLGTVLTLGRRSFWLGEIDIDGATVDLGFMHSLLRLDAVGAIDEFDVAKSTVMSAFIQTMIAEVDLPFGTASITISDDSNSRQLPEGFELASEPFLVDIVRKMTNEEVSLGSFVTHGLGLGLFSRRRGLSFGLALLRSWVSSLLILFFFALIRCAFRCTGRSLVAARLLVGRSLSRSVTATNLRVP